MIVAIDENMDLTAEFVLATMDDFEAQQNQVLILNYSRSLEAPFWLITS